MKTLFLECSMGASGDMLLAALCELLPDREAFLKTLNTLIPGVSVKASSAESCGISGTRTEVRVNGTEETSELLPGDGHEHCEHGTDEAHEHSEHGHLHHGANDIHALLSGLALPEEVRENASAVYDSIAEAEAAVHGVPVSKVHFHEVGALDAVADVAGVCYALYLLAPESICVSTIHTGYGQIHCAHGILPVPAPATARLLLGLPCCAGDIEGELCTPTGAALLRHFGQKFGPMPAMRTGLIGVGIGEKCFAAANCLRAFWGETDDEANHAIVELCCHIDDMTAEALAFSGERLMNIGALDVSYAPITMKKGRAGIAFTVLCRPADEARIAEAVLRETNTNGVRVRRCGKYILRPTLRMIETPYGQMQVKCAGDGRIYREKPEYESVAAAARKTGLPFQKVWEDVLLCIRRENCEKAGK